MNNNTFQYRIKPTLTLGFLLYFGYLLVFFSTWIFNKVEYQNIGRDAETTKLWYAFPALLGSVFLAIAISYLGWWKVLLFDKNKLGFKWLWILPIAMFAIILNTFLQIDTDTLTADLLLWSIVGAIGVGFGEEMITRGSLVVGLRTQFSERKIWFLSTLFFSVLHIPNVFFGLSASSMLIQLLLTFILGSGFYVMRRISGTLLLPMIIHGLWESSLFLTKATHTSSTVPIPLLIYPLAIICTIGFLFQSKNFELKT